MPSTVRTRSVFKYLLAGLLVSLLVLNSKALPMNANRRSVSLVETNLEDLEMRASPAKESPAKKAAAKKASTKKAPAKIAAAKKVTAKTGGSKKGNAVAAGAACPMQRPSKKLVKRSESLWRRAETVDYPPATSATTLFHGSYTLESAQSAEVPDLSKTDGKGDFHIKGDGCDGGFYLTDSLFAAAQFICYNLDGGFPETAYVNEYTWTPPQGVKVQAYQSNKDAKTFKKDCKAYDVLEGPMSGATDLHLTQFFHQYAIANQKTATAGLKFVKRYTIPCRNVEKGKKVAADKYKGGQKSNPNFAVHAAGLENPQAC